MSKFVERLSGQIIETISNGSVVQMKKDNGIVVHLLEMEFQMRIRDGRLVPVH